jgi:hypothetical protein
MPAREFYHDVVRAALIADGRTITNDPLRLHVGKKDLSVDLGMEHLLAADKEGRKIAVVVKSFLGASEVADLEHALGQYILYQGILEENDPDRLIYLAVPEEAHEELFQESIGQLLLKRRRLRLIIFDAERGRIVQWIPD